MTIRTYTDDEIDAFWTRPARRPVFVKPAQVPTARITCRVCDAAETAPIDRAGLLCDLCRADLDATARHVLDVRQRARNRYQDEQERFDAAVAHAEADVQQRYARIGQARVWATEAPNRIKAVNQRYQEALHAGDGLSRLLAREVDLWKAADECTRVCEWAERALMEIEAARDA